MKKIKSSGVLSNGCRLFYKMIYIENNTVANIKRIKRLLSRCYYTEVRGYSLEEWQKIVEVCGRVTFVFGFCSKGVVLYDVILGGMDPASPPSIVRERIKDLKKKEKIEEEENIIIRKQGYEYIEPPFKMR